jgi:hypothetical protein
MGIIDSMGTGAGAVTFPKTISLAERRAEIIAAEEDYFRTPLPLYVLYERRPCADGPNRIEVACASNHGHDGLALYLSPLDALLDAKVRNNTGRNLCVHPFEAIDPLTHLAHHEDWLCLNLVYGFAACGKKLVLSQRGELQAMATAFGNKITRGMCEHFQLPFHRDMFDFLNVLHSAAGLHDYGDILEDQANASPMELDGEAREAMERIGPAFIGKHIITDVALYDPIEQRWRFVPLAALRD